MATTREMLEEAGLGCSASDASVQTGIDAIDLLGGKKDMQETGNEPVLGLFDQCGKIQERLNEAHVITNKLIGAVPDNEIAAKDADTDYLSNLERKLRAILRSAGSLIERLQEMERRF